MAIADTGARFEIGRVFSRMIDLISKNFVPFAALSFLLAAVPYMAVLMLIPTQVGGDPSSAMVPLLLTYLVLVVASIVLQATLTRASVDYLTGKGVDIGAALSTALSKFLPLLGLGLLMFLGMLVGFILLVVPGVILMLMWIVAGPALVIEGLGVTQAMQRSAALTQNNRWAILGLLFLLGIALAIVQMIVFLALPGMMTGVGQFSTLGYIVLGLFQTMSAMIGTAMVASIYFELRQVKEGVGATDLAKVFS